MKKKFFFAIFLFFCTIAVPLPAQSIEPPPTIFLDIQGECREFNVTVSVDMFDYGLYDVKIDVFNPELGRVGEIFDPVQGWKSSVYYINDDLEINEYKNSNVFLVRANTYAEELNFICRLRSGNDVWDSEYYNITQSCDNLPYPSNEIILLVSSLVILVLLIGITVYMKILK